MSEGLGIRRLGSGLGCGRLNVTLRPGCDDICRVDGIALASEGYPPAPVRRAETSSEKTVVMPAGMAEMHSEMEIAFSQIKLLNKKVAALEFSTARKRGAIDRGL